MTDLLAMREELVSKRDAWTKAIDALDVVIAMGVGAPPKGTEAKKNGRTDGRTDGRTEQTARQRGAEPP